jgi:hypothetical protein
MRQGVERMIRAARSDLLNTELKPIFELLDDIGGVTQLILQQRHHSIVHETQRARAGVLTKFRQQLGHASCARRGITRGQGWISRGGRFANGIQGDGLRIATKAYKYRRALNQAKQQTSQSTR